MPHEPPGQAKSAELQCTCVSTAPQSGGEVETTSVPTALATIALPIVFIAVIVAHHFFARRSDERFAEAYERAQWKALAE